MIYEYKLTLQSAIHVPFRVQCIVDYNKKRSIKGKMKNIKIRVCWTTQAFGQKTVRKKTYWKTCTLMEDNIKTDLIHRTGGSEPGLCELLTMSTDTPS